MKLFSNTLSKKVIWQSSHLFCCTLFSQLMLCKFRHNSAIFAITKCLLIYKFLRYSISHNFVLWNFFPTRLQKKLFDRAATCFDVLSLSGDVQIISSNEDVWVRAVCAVYSHAQGVDAIIWSSPRAIKLSLFLKIF